MKRFIENRPSSDTARRPLPPLAGNLLFLGALFAMSLLVMAIEKPLFLLWYHAQAAEASAAELALVVWNGLKLDQTVAGYITALPLLVVLAALWIPGRWSRSVLKGYLLVIAAVAATAFAANLALYEYWAFPLDSSVLQYLASPKEALASVTAGQLLLQLLVAAAVFGGMAWCYLRVLRLYDPARRSTHRAGSTLVLLLAAGVLFLPIRGGVSVATANVSKVYFSGRMFLNHAAVNPLFSFLSTLSDGDDALYEYEFFPEPERAAIFEPLRGDLPAGIGTDTLLRTRRPNVVLFLVESFGRSTVDERVGGEPVAPEFQRLKGEGVYFDNLFANSFRTDRGTVAVLSGFPAQTKMSVMKLPVKSQRLPSIARSLRREGYATSFYYGGDLNFTNTASYLYGTGFDRLTWQKDLHFDAPTSKWGYADDVVIDAFGAWTEDPLPLHSTSLKHLCDILSGTDTRLLVVGGAGSLYVNPEHTVCVANGPDFPDIFKPLAAAMAKALGELRERKDVKWTYISPAGDFQADGGRTGKYILGGEELTLNSKGESVISYADYAIAMVDEAVDGNNIQKRISVVRE